MRNHVQHWEIFNSVNKTGVKACGLQGRIELGYDESCKSFCMNLNPGQITLPRSSRDSLEIITPYMMFQLLINPGNLFTIELAVTDLDNTRRRLIFTNVKQLTRSTMHVRIPNSFFNRNVWTDICIDIKSIFSQCFPGHTLKVVDSLCISGSLKLRKIVSLMKPAEFILPGLNEMHKFPIVSQMIDSNSIPSASPKYYSSSPITSITKDLRFNLFKRSEKRFKDLNQFKREFIVRANIGPTVKSPKLKRDHVEDIKRKITHNNLKQLSTYEDEIEENIEIEGNSWEDELMRKQTSKVYDSPEYYLHKVAEICVDRHETPPFVYSKDNIIYNPLYRYYEGL